MAQGHSTSGHLREKILEGRQTAVVRGSHSGRPKGIDDGMLAFAVALKSTGVLVPDTVKRLTVATGGNTGRHPSVTSPYRALAEPRKPPRPKAHTSSDPTAQCCNGACCDCRTDRSLPPVMGGDLFGARARAGELTASHERFVHRFARSEPRGSALAYIRGLIVPLERGNGWTPAGQAGHAGPDRIRRLLNRIEGDAQETR